MISMRELHICGWKCFTNSIFNTKLPYAHPLLWNMRENRNARSSAGQAVKTMRFYIKNHTDSAPPLHNSSTSRPTQLQSKGSCANFLRTPLGFPKRLPDKERFAPCNESKERKRRQTTPRRHDAMKFAPARTHEQFEARERSRAAMFW